MTKKEYTKPVLMDLSSKTRLAVATCETGTTPDLNGCTSGTRAGTPCSSGGLDGHVCNNGDWAVN